MRNLAGLYEKGDGVAKDAAEALRWRRAAKAPASPPGSTPIEAKSALVREFGPEEYDPTSLAFAREGNRILSLASGGYFTWLDPDNGDAACEVRTEFMLSGRDIAGRQAGGDRNL